MAPRELSIAEIQEYVQLYATAAENAITAGFDGVEGGSVANRVRFATEAVDAVVKKIGAQRTGIRVSPWGSFQDMRMEDPIPTYSHLAKTLLAAHPNLAYIHVVEPRVDGGSTRVGEVPANESNDFIRDIVRENGKGTKVISAGGYTRESGIEVADGKDDLIAYGRPFLANPDLPLRLKNVIPLNESNRKTYYLYGNFTPLGYTDYPFASETASRL